MRILEFKRFLPGTQNNIIQITGLVLGIVTCIFVGYYAFFEYSFDRFNTDADRIYRTMSTEGKSLASLAEEQLSYVEKTARLHPCYRGATVVMGEKSFYETNAYFGDGSLFDILDFPVVKGDVTKALTLKNQMVISESYAKKYFGDENAVGQSVIVNGSYEDNVTYTIAGIFKDIPKNSHVQFNILFSIENILSHRMYTQDPPWRWKNFFTYFKTSNPVGADRFGHILSALALNNGEPRTDDEGEPCAVFPLCDIHLNGQSNFMDSNATSRDVFIRIIIALTIMAIAWLNFINIGIGNVLKNKMAFSVKKVLGASSRRIWTELFMKTFILNFLALFIAVNLFFVLNSIVKGTGILQSIILPLSWQFGFWAFIFGVQIIGAFLVSLVLYGLISRQKLANALSNRSKSGKQNHSPWITLFVLQFGASIVLICFALLSGKQVKELISMDKGIETSEVLAIRSPYYSIGNNIDSDRKIFEQEALKIPGITSVTSASYIPGSTISSQMPTRLAGRNEEANISCSMNFVGYNYIPLFGHKLLAGRNFSEEFPTDATGIIINETLAKAYGFNNPDEAVGKEIYWESRNANRHIIGVMADFHHQSADMPVEPTMFQFWDLANGYCLLKISATNSMEKIKALEKLWINIHRSNAFDFLWIDMHYQKQFDKWVQLSQTVKVLSFIAILIACIGLFGLSSMLLDKRTKEIGIRKVNGARISEVMVMLNRNFVKWVAIAFAIATPIAYYAMNKWLENFACKTTLSWWIFALAGMVTLGITILTVSWQSWKTATRNPVEALRYE
jgi:putative ABC transport system permease protein